MIISCIYWHPAQYKSYWFLCLYVLLTSKNFKGRQNNNVNGWFYYWSTKKWYECWQHSIFRLNVCKLFLPYITNPTWETTHSKTLIDNINIEDGLISGNIISTISDHFAQFLLQKDIKNKQEQTKLILK